MYLSITNQYTLFFLDKKWYYRTYMKICKSWGLERKVRFVAEHANSRTLAVDTLAQRFQVTPVGIKRALSRFDIPVDDDGFAHIPLRIEKVPRPQKYKPEKVRGSKGYRTYPIRTEES